MKRVTPVILLLVSITLLIGCRQERSVSFEPNLVHAQQYTVSQDLPMDQVLADTEWALLPLFGTPDDPKIPQPVLDDPELAHLVSLDHLQRAAGPIEPADTEGGGGLYRRHCAVCHGVTGNGRGPTGALLNPYPRDFRAGVFKYKSTTRGAKPTREDLAKLIRNGIGGTPMNPIPGLTEEDVQALVDYVIYLSWRGEVERLTIDSAAMDLDLAGGERVVNPALAGLQDAELEPLSEEEEEQVDAFQEGLETVAETFEDQLTDRQLNRLNDPQVQSRVIALANDPELAKEAENLQALLARKHELDNQELFAEQWGYIVDAVVEVAESWAAAEEEVTEVDEPEGIPVPRDRAEFVAMMEGPEAEALQASVARGHELFISEAVGCAKCHGKEGKGDGQTNDYDDWTKEWTSKIGLDPKNQEAIVPLMARGALPPQNIKPRNFAEGIFRGGSAPEDLYRRIANGIAGTPMPGATFIEGKFERQDIWNLINYIRSLDRSEQADPSGQPDQAVGPQKPAVAAT